MAIAQRNGHDRPAARGTVQRLGLLLGLSALLILVAAPTFETFTAHAAQRLDQPPDHPHVLEVAGGMQMTLALMAIMVLWWITEAVPIPVHRPAARRPAPAPPRKTMHAPPGRALTRLKLEFRPVPQ